MLYIFQTRKLGGARMKYEHTLLLCSGFSTSFVDQEVSYFPIPSPKLKQRKRELEGRS